MPHAIIPAMIQKHGKHQNIGLSYKLTIPFERYDYQCWEPMKARVSQLRADQDQGFPDARAAKHMGARKHK